MKNLTKRPWLLVIAAFAVLITSWVCLLRLAAKYQPESVPIEVSSRYHEDQ